MPLLVDGRPVGTLAVLSYTDHRYEAPDALFLSLLAAIVTPALESARLASEVKRQARSVAQIYEALPVMVVVYGRDGKAIQHNSAAEAALGGELLDGVRERAIPLVWEDGTPIPADERPFARALKTKAPVRGTIVGYGGATRVCHRSEQRRVDRLTSYRPRGRRNDDSEQHGQTEPPYFSQAARSRRCEPLTVCWPHDHTPAFAKFLSP